MTLEEFADRLGRPTTAVAGLRGLSAQDLERLAAAIDRTRERHRDRLDAEFDRAIPFVPAAVVRKVLAE